MVVILGVPFISGRTIFPWFPCDLTHTHTQSLENPPSNGFVSKRGYYPKSSWISSFPLKYGHRLGWASFFHFQTHIKNGILLAKYHIISPFSLAQTSSLVVKIISRKHPHWIYLVIYPIRYTHSAHSCHIKALFFLVKLILSPFWMAHSLEFSILDD